MRPRPPQMSPTSKPRNIAKPTGWRMAKSTLANAASESNNTPTSLRGLAVDPRGRHDVGALLDPVARFVGRLRCSAQAGLRGVVRARIIATHLGRRQAH